MQLVFVSLCSFVESVVFAGIDTPSGALRRARCSLGTLTQFITFNACIYIKMRLSSRVVIPVAIPK